MSLMGSTQQQIPELKMILLTTMGTRTSSPSTPMIPKIFSSSAPHFVSSSDVGFLTPILTKQNNSCANTAQNLFRYDTRPYVVDTVLTYLYDLVIWVWGYQTQPPLCDTYQRLCPQLRPTSRFLDLSLRATEQGPKIIQDQQQWSRRARNNFFWGVSENLSCKSTSACSYIISH